MCPRRADFKKWLHLFAQQISSHGALHAMRLHSCLFAAAGVIYPVSVQKCLRILTCKLFSLKCIPLVDWLSNLVKTTCWSRPSWKLDSSPGFEHAKPSSSNVTVTPGHAVILWARNDVIRNMKNLIIKIIHLKWLFNKPRYEITWVICILTAQSPDIKFWNIILSRLLLRKKRKDLFSFSLL